MTTLNVPYIIEQARQKDAKAQLKVLKRIARALEEIAGTASPAGPYSVIVDEAMEMADPHDPIAAVDEANDADQ